MAPHSYLAFLDFFEIVLCVAALVAITVKRQWSDYWSLGSFLLVRTLSSLACTWIVHFGRPLGASLAYNLYFYVYWSSFAIESLLSLMVIYSVFRLAMAPLKGLQGLGMLVFRWAGAISVAVALGSAFAPNHNVSEYIMAAVNQLQRTEGILTLCLLLFVCFAIRPMGLSYSSRIFGVSLGLGMMATANLVQSAWTAVHASHMNTSDNLIKGVVVCLTLLTWTAYFVLPEPKRRMIVLPTTSPFLRWNQISLALGDDPGFVAVGGIPPELFAPAEIEIMRRASLKMVTPAPEVVAGRIA